MDVNDAFEQIFLSEERIAEESYKQGFEKGVCEGNLEAYHLGKRDPRVIYLCIFNNSLLRFSSRR